MTLDRRIRPALLVSGWVLIVVAALWEAVGQSTPVFGDLGSFLLLLVGMSGLALASLAASLDTDPVVLDRRIVGFSSEQRRLLRYAAMGLGLGIPAGAVASVIGDAVIGAALTLVGVIVGLSLLGVVLGRSLRYAILGEPSADVDADADAK
jgi:hypothetical protein